MADLRTSIVIDLTGNLARRAHNFGKSLADLGRSGTRHMGGLSRAVSATGRALDRMGNRYTALLTGAAGVGAARMVIALEERFARLGIQANKSAEDMDALKREIYATAQAANVRVDPGEITSAIEAIVEKTGDLDFARENIRNIGLTIQATGAQGAAVGELVAELQKMGAFKGPQQVLEALDTMNVQGKEGAFTLQNLAALGPRVITAYASATKGARDGATLLKEMGAALQVIRMGTGSSEQAATSFERLLAELQNVDKLKQLKANGIQVFDPKQPGAEVMRPINELLLEIMEKTQGRKTLLGQVFGDESIRAFNALTPERIERFMAAQGDGSTTMRDAARAARTASGALTNLYTAWKRFADSNLSGPIQSAADALNSLEPETVQRWMNVGKWVLGAAGAAYVGSKIFRAGRGLTRMFKGGGGAAGALGGAAGMAGVVPVYVVNLPGGGMGGLPGGAGKRVRTPGRLRMLRAAPSLKAIGAMGAGAVGTAGLAVAGAGAAGYGVGTVINDNFVAGTKASDTIGRGIAKFLAFFGNDEAQAALASERRYQEGMRGELRIQIDQDGRAKIKQMRGENLDLAVDTGPVMGP